MNRYFSLTPDEAKEVLDLAKKIAGETHEPRLSVDRSPDGSYTVSGDPAGVIVACERLAEFAPDASRGECKYSCAETSRS